MHLTTAQLAQAHDARNILIQIQWSLQVAPELRNQAMRAQIAIAEMIKLNTRFTVSQEVQQ